MTVTGWLSIREASEVLHVSPRTIRRMVRSGALPSRLEGGLRLVLLGGSPETHQTSQAGWQNSLLLDLLGLYEDLYSLLERANDVVWGRRAAEHFFAGLIETEGVPGSKEWAELYMKIMDCQKDVDHLVSRLNLDPDTLQNLYRQLLGVRAIWARYSEWEGEDQEEDTFRANRQGLVLLDKIGGDLRRLLIGSTAVGERP